MSEAEDARAAARRIVAQVLADRGEPALADGGAPALADRDEPVLVVTGAEDAAAPSSPAVSVEVEAAREELLFADRGPSGSRAQAHELVVDALSPPSTGSETNGVVEARPDDAGGPGDAAPGAPGPAPADTDPATAEPDVADVPASRLRARELVAAVLAEAEERERRARREAEEAAAREAERERLEVEAHEEDRARTETARAEVARVGAERAQRERAEVEAHEEERARTEAARVAAERAEREQAEAERVERELDAERAERDRAEVEAREAERADARDRDRHGGGARRDTSADRTAPLSVAELAASERTSRLPQVDGSGPGATAAYPVGDADAPAGRGVADVPTSVVARPDGPRAVEPTAQPAARGGTEDEERSARRADPSSTRASLPAVTAPDRSTPGVDEALDAGQDEDHAAPADRTGGRVLEATVEVPAPTEPPRGGRWLMASIIGAILLAVLFPLAVDALRTLVEL